MIGECGRQQVAPGVDAGKALLCCRTKTSLEEPESTGPRSRSFFSIFASTFGLYASGCLRLKIGNEARELLSRKAQ